jgi:tetratricopeptide (TPR) repeat protein
LSHVPEPMIDEALSAAHAALSARQRSPTEALAAAEAIVARHDISDVARLVGLWAIGLAERELSRLEDAETHLREAISLGEQIGADTLVGQVGSALTVVLAARGKLDEALAVAAAARPLVPATERADLEMRRGLVLEQMGRLDDALDAYTAALSFVGESDDPVLEARLLCNRSVVYAFQGRVDEALADSLQAEQQAVEHGQYFLAGGAAHNHAFAAGLQGDIVTGLASFARADDLYARVGHPGRSAGVLASDRCELMIAAGLFDEARANAELAVRSLEEVGDVSDLAEARLLLARACLVQGDVETAHREALTALDTFSESSREGWAAIAEYVAVSALQASASLRTLDALDQADTIAARLERLGWTSESASVRVSSAELAIQLGDTAFARSQLLLIADARDRGRPDRRASAWLATAMLRRSESDRAGARRAVTAGLDVLARHQATLGATDLRVGATTHAQKLATLGLSIALESGRPRDVLTWAERVRANALAIAPVRPPADSPLTAALRELRRRRVELDEARRALAVDRQQELAVDRMEAAVRDLARTVRGDAADRRRFSVGSLIARLGEDRQLVEYVEVDGVLAAVVVSAGRCSLRRLGTVRDVFPVLDGALFALTRLAREGVSEASQAASLASLSESLDALDALLVRPLRLSAPGIVIVPTGVLHNMPWGGIPSLTSRPTSVATSATRWSPPPERPDPGGSVGLITGPDLPAASTELAMVAAAYRSSDALTGDRSSVAAALSLLDRATTAHIACHGHFRRDAPMFSSLAMADGPLTVYDIESLSSPPSLVVLPACNAGSASVSVGDELIGTASALLGTGVGSVIAPLAVVNDASTVEVMAALHRHLSTGRSPSEALADTRVEITGGDDPAALASALSFLCLE